MFEANSRFIQIQAKSKKSDKNPKSVSLATTANVTGRSSNVKYSCTLCSFDKASNASNHRLNSCPRYSDPKSRVERLKTIGGCCKCGSISHNSKTCTVRLSPCFKCSKYHMSYLCISPSKNVKDKEKSTHNSASFSNKEQSSNEAVSLGKVKKNSSGEATSTSNNMLTFCNLSKSFSDVILPTGTVYVERGDCKVPWRIFKDLGSQTTFVRGSPANIPNCKVIGEVNLKVQGINSDKVHNSVLVEFPVHVPGQGQQKIRAVCIENIKTQVHVPGLKSLLKQLKDKGYKLADVELEGDIIDNISILLGSDHSHIFPLTQHNFSSNNKTPSVLFDTPSGVMLSGSISQYIENIHNFPTKDRVKPRYRKDRYSKRTHKVLKVGDLVSIKEKFSKPFDYPLGIVVKVESNDLNEVTSAHIRKTNGEIIRRHVDNLIFLTESSSNIDLTNSVEARDSIEAVDAANSPPKPMKRKKRAAAQKCEDLNRAIFNSSLTDDPVFLNNFNSTAICLVCSQLLSEWESGGSLL